MRDIKKEFDSLIETCRKEKGMTFHESLCYAMKYHLDLHEQYLVAMNPNGNVKLDIEKIKKWRKRIETVTM